MESSVKQCLSAFSIADTVVGKSKACKDQGEKQSERIHPSV